MATVVAGTSTSFRAPSIGWRPRRHVVHARRALEGDDARERDVETQLERPFGERAIFAEAVDDTADVGRSFCAEDVQRVGGCAARVYHQRLAELARHADEVSEHAALHVAR